MSSTSSNKNVLMAIIGGVIVVSSVIAVSSLADFLPEGSDFKPWYIGAAVASLVGWVLLFIGMLGLRKT
ncbi:MAG: hypothetical protein OCD03_03800 [Hyphomicrobiales bacterium]